MERPGLTITLAVSNDCEELNLTDSTGTYNVSTNPDGYGLPDGPAVNDVTGVEINVSYDTQGTSITYEFTVASGVITAATLAVADGTPEDILAELVSTTWPLTSFNLVADYGVTIPEFDLGVFSIDYTITGLVSGQPFAFTTSKSILNPCETRCCIAELFADIDADCDCADDAICKAMTARAYLLAATYAAQSGNTDDAVKNLNKASDICTGNGGCGCGG